MKRANPRTARAAYLCAALVGIGCLVLPAVIRAESQDETDIVIAKKAFGDGFYDLAQERLESFLKNHPGDPRLYEAHALLGKSYYYRNNFTGALYEFETVLGSPQASAFHDEALYWSGEIYLKNGDLKRALSLYEQVISSFPASRYAGYAIYSKGWAYYRLGLFEEALACYRQVVSQYPYEKLAVEAQFRIGECEYRLSRYADAGASLGRFIETYPVSEKTADAYYMRGEALFYQGAYREALSSFERALSIAPKAAWAPFAAYRTAEALLETGEYDKSAAAFRRLLGQPSAETLQDACRMGLIKSYEKAGKAADALALCDETIALRPAGEIVPEVLCRKAKLLYGAGRYAEAEAACTDALGRFPRSAFADELRYELGWACAAQGKADAALDAFLAVEQHAADANLRASAICKTGDIYFDRKEYARALERYDVVLDKYPDSFWADYAQFQVGTIFSLTGKYSQAVMAYQSLLANFPNSSWRDKSVFALGAAYFKIGDFERSAAEFRRLVHDATDAALAVRARLYLANSLYSMKQYADAVAVLAEVDREGVDPALRMLARYQMGWCYYGMRREADALALFNAFLKEYPGSAIAVDVKFWFAEYYRAKKEYGRARDYYTSILNEHPGDETGEEALYAIGLTYAEEGMPGQAAASFEELGRRFPGSAVARTAYRKMAHLRKDEKDLDGAIASLARALTSDNDETNAQVQYEIAECYELKGDAVRAVEEYLKVPYLYAKGTFWSVRAQLKCAQLLERLERYDEARKMYEKLSAMDIEESQFAKQRLEWLKWRGGTN